MISDHCILRPGQRMRVFLTKADRDQALAEEKSNRVHQLTLETMERSRMLEVMDDD
jgi:hypothetical protein